ncbi:M4 family metallopeptidase [Amycolatopsis sp. H20-H5]|uniref:M4 family metallopeptidase n=1 Tax=Amycolatopsis sp. H20-H5 TaxID=3046309 RepID=UPI002DB56A89|nr:M4 family metallopeptidase [Amycolatopsis sp. H20-H5]MEC3982627.1 M4 family metallopeptidase [Amycolatopsis sp. H20-H5]
MSASHRHSIFCILPPHILESIAERAPDSDVRRAVLDVLSIDNTVRSFRITEQFITAVSEVSPSLTPHLQRYVYNASQTQNLPGSLVRSEGQAASGDVGVDEAYDGLGATFTLYWDVFGRNSIDNAGLDLKGTVHYGTRYDNAFWNGSQMVFGDGDGVYFNRFTIALDVIGHELTHGVTGHQANLVYHDQPGALNESISDVFGCLVKQYALHQSAAQADWLIGQGLLAASVHGVALRSMKAPGTAYDDPHLGKDPQPDHMSHYVTTTSDNGGVHINSGIPNKAFYLVATALGANAWDKAGRIWYTTLCDPRLSSTAQFIDFANLTAANASLLFGSAEAQAVIDAWEQVGIHVTFATPKISGNWVLHYSWGATSNYAQTTLSFNSNGTFSGPLTGKWHQQDGTVLLSFDTGPAKYAGTVDGSVGSGAMSTFAGLDGAWYLSKQGTVGIVKSVRTSVAPGAADASGNGFAAAAAPESTEAAHRKTSA